MIIPMNCFTCAKPIAHLYHEYKNKIEEYKLDEIEEYKLDEKSKSNKKSAEFRALADLHIGRDCCRRMFLCQHDMYKKVR